MYVVEQAEPVRRTVPLKVIKPGMDSQQVIARFEAERQALALMDHPNIARVLDAGSTETGRPYFLSDEPVLACPPSATYRLRKFARRHKGPVAAVSLVLLSLVAGIIGTTGPWSAPRRHATTRTQPNAQPPRAPKRNTGPE